MVQCMGIYVFGTKENENIVQALPWSLMAPRDAAGEAPGFYFICFYHLG